jgi:hypothetical protein
MAERANFSVSAGSDGAQFAIVLRLRLPAGAGNVRHATGQKENLK